MSPSPEGGQPERNRLLASLPRSEYDVLAPHIESLHVAVRHSLSVRGEPIDYVHFPRGAVMSIVVDMEGGEMVEGATIGHEGIVGLAVYLGDGTGTETAFCQVPGMTARVRTADFRAAVDRSPALQRILRRYALALMGQMTRTAGCNRAHPLEERCARWLLMTRDRVGEDEFSLTHEFLAAMLGVRRATVTVAAGMLQQAGLIDYRRGHMRILDRERLEAAACEDYRLTNAIYDQLLPSADGIG